MFSFFHRTPKIILDCYTTAINVYECTPIVKSSKTIPDWWKDLPNFQFILDKNEKKVFEPKVVNNLKNCYAFLELYSNSISIRHWADMYLEIDKDDYSYYVSSGIKPEWHSREQIGKGFKNYHHIKLSSPWMFREKEQIKFAWFGAAWNLEDYDFIVLPGITNFYVNHDTNVNLMIPKIVKNYMIPAGLPLVNLIPLTEKKVIIKNHLVSQVEFEKYKNSAATNYFHGWRTFQKLIHKEKKCPFD